MDVNSLDNSVETLRKLGNEKFRSLNYGAALMHYTQAIDKNPENFALYYNRAVTFVKMDNIDEAKEDLLRSLEINPEYIPSLCQLGFIYLYQGNTPDSLESYVRVVKINESLPNQLSRFKAQLKEAIRLAESRCKQQEYPQEFIDNIITPEIRSILDSYPNLPTHMVESGIPPVSFGNVPISHHGSNQSTAIIARGSIPISLSNLTNINNNDRNNNQNNATQTQAQAQTQTQPSEPTNPVNEAISRALNISGLANVLNTPGVSASVSVAGSQNPQDLMNVLGNLTNTSLNSANTIVTPAGASSNTGTDANINNNNTNNNPSNNSPVIINPLSLRSPTNPTITGLSPTLLQQHQAAHQAALNRAAELRRQREQEHGVPTTVNASSSTSATTVSPPSPLPTPLESTASTSTTTTTAAAAPSVTTPISPNATTTADFAQHFANTIATQLNNAAAQNSSSVGPNATPNSTAIQSLTQNLTSIASGVLGGLATGSNFVSMVTNSGNNNNSNSGHNNSNERPLDADLDMDLD